ncbi:hypothetical protein DFQ26_003539 [Actinomortierella ambigua]|nr:hypothetical protein DFQ26_003539 [Actinomortierella ambigua]
MSQRHTQRHEEVLHTDSPPASPSPPTFSAHTDSSLNSNGMIDKTGHRKTLDANSVSGSTAPAMQPNQSRERRPPSTHTVEPPPVAHAHDVILQGRKRTWGSWIFRLTLVWLGYVMLFVCPNLPEKESGLVCRGLHRVQEWISPLSDPLYTKVDETYRTYGEPLVDQYGRPLVQQGQQYYADYAQPAFETASKRTKDAYAQYAHPHVVRAKDAIYTDQVKGHLEYAQTNFNAYSKQAQAKVDEARKATQQATDHAWHWHHVHVQPTINKVSPHAKVAWDSASLSAHRIYSGASELYMKHINPFAEHAMLLLAERADQLFGSHLVKQLNSRKKKQGPMDKIYQQSDKIKHQTAEQAKGLKGWWRKKTAAVQQATSDYAESAQKMAGQFSDSIQERSAEWVASVKGMAGSAKDAAEHVKEETEKQAASAKESMEAANKGAQEKAKQVVDHVSEAVSQKVQEAQKMATDTLHNVEHAAGEAGRKVMEKAHDAEEAVKGTFNSKTDEIKHMAGKAQRDAQEAVEQAQKRVEHAAEQVRKQGSETVHHAKEKVEKTSDQLKHDAEDLRAKATDTLKDAHAQAAKKAGETAQHVREKSNEAKENVQHKYEDIKGAASEQRHNVEKQVKKAQEAAQDHAKDAKERFEEMFSYGKDTAEQFVMDATRAKDQAIKDTTKKLGNAKENAETSLKALLAGIEATFGHFRTLEDNVTKDVWGRLLSAIEEHKTKVMKGVKDVEETNAKTYREFEDFIKKWSTDASGTVEDRLLQLRQQADKVVVEIGHRTAKKQQEGQGKIETLTHNVETYANGLRDFLLDRLAAAKETAQVEFNIFKDTSSRKDKVTAENKLLSLEKQGRKKVEDAGADVSKKAHQLLEEVQRLWDVSGQQTKDLTQKVRTQSLKASEQAKKAGEQAKKAAAGAGESVKNKAKEATTKVESVVEDATQKKKQPTKKEAIKGKVEEASEKMQFTVKEAAGRVQENVKKVLTPGENDSSQKSDPSYFDNVQEPNVKVAYEEPRSGHRHQRH